MVTFLNLPKSKNDWENTRINMDQVVCYSHDPVNNRIDFILSDGSKYNMGLENLDHKKIIKKIDALTKVVKLELTKADARKK